MTLKWSCFISYRIGKGALASGIVDDLYQRLSDELEMQWDARVYLSQGELRAGDILDSSVAAALCHSACMVILFTGTYFSKQHPYCTREYLAMKELEARRLQRLGLSVSKQHGLIIPVVLRNLEHMPAELKRRMWSDLQEFQQAESGIARPITYFDEIRRLGDYIASRCRELNELPEDAGFCEQFTLPDDESAKNFLTTLAQDTRKTGEEVS